MEQYDEQTERLLCDDGDNGDNGDDEDENNELESVSHLPYLLQKQA